MGLIFGRGISCLHLIRNSVFVQVPVHERRRVVLKSAIPFTIHPYTSAGWMDGGCTESETELANPDLFDYDTKKPRAF